VSTSRTYTSLTTLPAASVADLAQGTIGYAQVTASQGSITTLADLTGLTVTVTLVAGRRIRIVGSVLVGSTVATDVIRLHIREGATDLQIRDTVPSVVSGTTTNINLECSVVLQPSAASHTYKLSLERLAGTGTLTMGAGATYPAFILCEDIGQ
jgi:hypothetical protein